MTRGLAGLPTGWALAALLSTTACSGSAGTEARDTGTDTDGGDTGADSGSVDTSDSGANGACADLAGSVWESVDALECGLGPDGVALCHWRVRFDAAGTFTWSYSDVAEGGGWSCEGDALTATTDGGRGLATTLHDPSHLDWEGVAYLRDGAR